MFHRLPAAVDHRAESKPSDDEDSLDEEDSDSKTDIPDVRVIPCVERKQIQQWMGKEMRQWDRLQHLPSNKLWKTDVNKEAKEIEIPKEKLNVIRYNSESYFSILKHATYKILKTKKQ